MSGDSACYGAGIAGACAKTVRRVERCLSLAVFTASTTIRRNMAKKCEGDA